MPKARPNGDASGYIYIYSKGIYIYTYIPYGYLEVQRFYRNQPLRLIRGPRQSRGRNAHLSKSKLIQGPCSMVNSRSTFLHFCASSGGPLTVIRCGLGISLKNDTLFCNFPACFAKNWPQKWPIKIPQVKTKEDNVDWEVTLTFLKRSHDKQL